MNVCSSGVLLSMTIAKEDYNLHCFDQALTLVSSFSSGPLMAKRDLKHAFRLRPVSPSYWDLLGMHWQEKFYVVLHLPFGLRSSPFLFNRLADAFDTEERLRYPSPYALPIWLLYRRITTFTILQTGGSTHFLGLSWYIHWLQYHVMFSTSGQFLWATGWMNFRPGLLARIVSKGTFLPPLPVESSQLVASSSGAWLTWVRLVAFPTIIYHSHWSSKGCSLAAGMAVLSSLILYFSFFHFYSIFIVESRSPTGNFKLK